MTLFDAPRTSEITLRPYQDQAVAAVDGARARGLRSGLIVLATGGGKTTIFSHLIGEEAKRGGRSLILAHRDELLDQAADRIASMTDVRVDIECGDRRAIGTAEAVVASVATLGRHGSARMSWFRPTLIVTDEAHHACFVAGTMIGERPMEKVRVGDSVWAFDHWQGCQVESTVTDVMRRLPKALVRVTFENGQSFICTPEHPVWIVDGPSVGSPGIYKMARDLKVGNVALFITNESKHTTQELHQAKDLLDLRDGLPAEKLDAENGPVLLGAMQARSSRSPEVEAGSALSSVRKGGALDGQVLPGNASSRSGLLLGGVQAGVPERQCVGDDGGNQSQVRERAHDKPQPSAEARRSGEDFSGATREGPDGEGWQWGIDYAADSACASPGPPDGIRGPDCECCQSIHGEVAIGIQDRHRGPGADAGDRGRREHTSELRNQGEGRTQNPRLERTRVESVEVLEPGSDGRFGGLCPDGFVYNLTVANYHNYCANGILVHNCADSYQAVYNRFACEFHLGVTATAHRMDNKPLHGSDKAIYEAVLFEYGIKSMILDGWLCDIRAYKCDASYSLKGVKVTAGDYNQKELDKKVNTNRNNKEAFYHWREVAADRRTIVFCTSVAHAHAMADLFVGCGVVAEAVDGAMDKGLRAGIMARFKSGETQVLTNCNIATEGFDCPEAACILLLRPTKSWSLFVQMIGRGLRLSPGKEDCIVIDVDGAGDDKSLASVPSVLGLPPSAKQEGKSFKQLMIKVDGLPEDMRARLGRKPFDLTSIDTVLAEVDMLRDLAPPEEIVRGSQWAWQFVCDGCYAIWCGSDASKTKTRKATLRSDALGSWSLSLVEGEDGPLPEVVYEGIEPEKALRAADNAIRSAWPGLDGFLRRDAPWRNKTGEASEKQKYWLKKFGLTDEEIEGMTRAQVSTFLDRKFQKGRR